RRTGPPPDQRRYRGDDTGARAEGRCAVPGKPSADVQGGFSYYQVCRERAVQSSLGRREAAWSRAPFVLLRRSGDVAAWGTVRYRTSNEAGTSPKLCHADRNPGPLLVAMTR